MKQIPEELSCTVFVQFHHHIRQNHVGQMYKAHLINGTYIDKQLVISGTTTSTSLLLVALLSIGQV